MDIQDFLDEELESAEKKAVSLKGKPRLIDVFRVNFEPWTTRLFPAWKLAEDDEGLGKSSYRRLATLLVKCGYDKVTEETVARYMSLVRKERETKGSVKSSSPTPKVQIRPGAVAVAPTPVVEEEVAFPLGGLSFKQVKVDAQAANEWNDVLEGHWQRFMAQADVLGWNQVKRTNSQFWGEYGSSIGSGELKFAFVNLLQARKRFLPEE